MIEVRQTEIFSKWFAGLSDQVAGRVLTRIRRLETGNPGDAKSVGGGVSELRIDCGPGYRLYFAKRGNTLIILLCGGDKRMQSRDIAKAQQIAKDV